MGFKKKKEKFIMTEEIMNNVVEEMPIDDVDLGIDMGNPLVVAGVVAVGTFVGIGASKLVYNFALPALGKGLVKLGTAIQGKAKEIKANKTTDKKNAKKVEKVDGEIVEEKPAE